VINTFTNFIFYSIENIVDIKPMKTIADKLRKKILGM